MEPALSLLFPWPYSWPYSWPCRSAARSSAAGRLFIAFMADGRGWQLTPAQVRHRGRYPGARKIRKAASETRFDRGRIRFDRGRICFDQGRVRQIALRPRGQRLERPAGRQHQLISVGQGIDAGLIESDNRAPIGPIAERLAVASRDVDLVADCDILQKAKMRIAMRRIDRDPALAGVDGLLDMARTERQRMAAAAGKRDCGGMKAPHLDPGHRPGVGPAPRFYGMAGRDGLRKSALQQHLRE